MQHLSVRIVGICLLGVLLSAFAVGYFNAPPRHSAVGLGQVPALPIAGRYQLTIQEDTQYLLDTQTGRLWSHIGTGQASGWQPEAGPPPTNP